MNNNIDMMMMNESEYSRNISNDLWYEELTQLDLRLDDASRRLAEEVRNGELYPTTVSAMRCERLYRVVAALEHRKKALLAATRTFQPQKTFETKINTKDQEFVKMNNRKTTMRNRPMERWMHADDNANQWHWKGRALKVVKQVLYADSDLVNKLITKATDLEKRLDMNSKTSKTNGDKNNYTTGVAAEWSEDFRQKVAEGAKKGDQHIEAKKKEEKQLQEKAKKIQADILEKNAVAIQARFRGYLGRKKMRDAKKKYSSKIKHEGASVIQANFRGHMARLNVRNKKSEHEEMVATMAATTLQAHVRGKFARDKYKHAKSAKDQQLGAAMMIQAWWRGVCCRIQFYTMREEYLAKIAEDAAIMVQCAWRSRCACKEKARLMKLKEEAMTEAAAIMVQAAYRGWMARKKLHSLRKERKKVLARQLELEEENKALLERHAKMLLDAKQRAAILIQSAARRYLARKRVGALRSARGNAPATTTAPTPSTKKSNIVYDSLVEVPLENANGKQSRILLQVRVAEKRKPYHLSIDAECKGMRGVPKFNRKIDIAVLDQLLTPLFEGDQKFDNDKESKMMKRWIRTGKPPRRSQLIQWIMDRIWIEVAPNGTYELCLGTQSTKVENKYDRSLNRALSMTSPVRASEPVIKSASKTKRGATRDSFKIRYANQNHMSQ